MRKLRLRMERYPHTDAVTRRGEKYSAWHKEYWQLLLDAISALSYPLEAEALRDLCFPARPAPSASPPVRVAPENGRRGRRSPPLGGD